MINEKDILDSGEQDFIADRNLEAALQEDRVGGDLVSRIARLVNTNRVYIELQRCFKRSGETEKARQLKEDIERNLHSLQMYMEIAIGTRGENSSGHILDFRNLGIDVWE